MTPSYLFSTSLVSISITEIAVVFVVALLLFGPEQLPVIARGLGKLAHEWRKTSDSLRREFYNSVYSPAEEVRRDIAAEGRSLRALRAEVMAPPPGSAATPVRPFSPSASSDGTTQPSPEPANADHADKPTRTGGAQA